MDGLLTAWFHQELKDTDPKKLPMNHRLSRTKHTDFSQLSICGNLKPTRITTPLKSCELCQCMNGCFWAAHVLFKNSLWKVMDCGRMSISYAYWSQNVWAAEHLSSETVMKLRIVRRFDHVLKRLSWVGTYNLLPLNNLIMSHVFWYPMFHLYTITCKVVNYLTLRNTCMCWFGREWNSRGHINPWANFWSTSHLFIFNIKNDCHWLPVIHVGSVLLYVVSVFIYKYLRGN